MVIETLRPNNPGDECNIDGQTGAACPNHYQNVDETPPDDPTTTVQTTNITYLRDFYNITNSAISSGTINKIRVYARCLGISGDIAPPYTCLKIVIKSGTGAGAPDTPSESGEIAIGVNWANYSNDWVNNPATAAAWTWDEIDQLQAGVSIHFCSASGRTRNNTYCTQVYVEVDYTPAVGTNMQINISDTLKDIDEIKINIGGVLKDVTEAKINIGGVLKDVF